ncbi:DUF4136 domain-containing protein [Atopomonas sediminilitoris]|uniref:DUF4136 domain-containing protein n=1 Tax=Atopomonas sediminilitoris TaxID=2919919 RepID=UPI001F4ED9BA|nr:DUF4136 domain-containing protein [Atopomonas sediminilitoris]
MSTLRHFTRLLCLAFITVALVGCTSKPLLTPQEALYSGKTEQQVHDAIMTGLEQRGWTVTAQRPQLIQAKIVVRAKHGAEIDIPYSATMFSINYRDSFGLDYKEGKIHRNYNRWVNNLRAVIAQQLN